MARLKAIIAIILLVGLGECARDLTKCVIGKEEKYLKKNLANFSEWVRSARKPMFSSAVNKYMFYNFPSTLKLQN